MLKHTHKGEIIVWKDNAETEVKKKIKKNEIRSKKTYWNAKLLKLCICMFVSVCVNIKPCTQKSNRKSC